MAGAHSHNGKGNNMTYKKALSKKLIEDVQAFDSRAHKHMKIGEFINKILEYNPKADFDVIIRAFKFAHESHKGQTRHSGEAYINHLIETALVLMDMKADSASICAGLLHDCIEDCGVTSEQLKKRFGDEITLLVEGVTKIRERMPTKEEYNATNLRKIMLASTKDIRVILIKLADRLHNMRTLSSSNFRPEKKERIARETMDIYAPIAHKLGVRSLKGELEDLAFKILDPESYKRIRERIAEKRGEREKKTKLFIKSVTEKLKSMNIESEVIGRAKYFYSIYQKMRKRRKDFSEIYDLIALRIIVDTIPDCYTALGVVHELWKPIPRRFKDYVSLPKANGYQSLHTSVVGSHGKIIEIQIRTRDMHNIAEAGIAAHWRYKGSERDKKFDRKLSWLKQLLEWKQESKTAREFVETLRIDLFENEIVVFTPKGDPISLPENSTPVDFAYAVHTNVGTHCSKVEVNGHIVPLDYILQSGDVVKVYTQKNASPSRNWLSFVKTGKARSKIRSKLNIKSDISRSGDIGVSEKSLKERIIISGSKPVKPANIKFSKCCSPQYKSPILAFFTKDKKVTIHGKECPNIHALDQSKGVVAAWKEEALPDLKKFKVIVHDRVGLLAEILNFLSKSRVNVHSINTRSKKDKVAITFKLTVPKVIDFQNLIATIREIPGVIDIKKYNDSGKEVGPER